MVLHRVIDSTARERSHSWLCILTVGLVLARLSVAAPGSIDSSFLFTNAFNRAVNTLVVQADGKIIIGLAFGSLGTNGNSLARLTAEGLVDPSFVPAFYASRVGAIDLQPDGSMLVAYNDSSGVVRVTSSGARDPTFDTAIVHPAFATRVKAQPDGRVVVATENRLLRLTSSGQQDVSFRPQQNSGRSPVVKAILPTAKGLIVAGPNDYVFRGLERVLPDGTFDRSFGNSNGFIFPFYDSTVVVAEQSDRKLIIAGSFTNAFGMPGKGIVRVDENGALDPSFDPGLGAVGIGAVTIQPDGKILIGGNFTSVNGVSRDRIARLLPSGSVDSSFIPDKLPTGSVSSIALQPDGRIIAGGSFGLVRLENGPSLPPEITAHPVDVTAVEGRKTELSVVARAFPAPTYFWFHTNSLVRVTADNVLRFDAVSLGNAGAYQVVVSNASGSITSAPAALTIAPAPVQPGRPTLDFNASVDGVVTSIAEFPDGRLVIGGDFRRVGGLVRSNLAVLNPDGSVDQNFDAKLASYTVQKVGTYSNSVIAVGSMWQPYPGSAWIARLALDGTRYPGFVTNTFDMTSALYGRINDFAIDEEGLIIAVGDFTLPSLRRNIARLKADGSLASSFAQTSSGQELVQIERAMDGSFFVSGPFGPTTHFNLNGSDTGWRLTNNLYAYQRGDMAVRPDASVIVFDGFYLWFLDSTGRVETNFFFAFWPNKVFAQPDGKILVCSPNYWNVDQRIQAITRLNRNGSIDSSFDPGSGSAVEITAALVSGTNIFVAGWFTEFDGAIRHGIVKLYGGPPASPVIPQAPRAFVPAPPPAFFDPTPPLPLPVPSWGAPLRLETYVVGLPSPEIRWYRDGVYVGSGAFLEVRNLHPMNAGNYVAIASNEFGTTSTAITLPLTNLPTIAGAPDFEFLSTRTENLGSIRARAFRSDGRLVIAGGSDRGSPFDPTSYPVIGLLPNGETDPAFNAGRGADNLIHALAIDQNDRILVGGYFTNFNGVERRRIARLQANGALDLDFAPTGADSLIEVLLVTDDAIIVGGAFTNFNGVPRRGLVRLGHSGAVDESFTSQIVGKGSVLNLLRAATGHLYVSGNFTNVSGFTRAGVARLRPDGQVDQTFNAELPANATVQALALAPDGRALVGGTFSNIAGVDQRNIAMLLPDGSLDMSFRPPLVLSGIVRNFLVQSDGKVLVAGDDSGSIPGLVRSFRGLARLNADGSLDPTFVTLAFGTVGLPSVYWIEPAENGRILIGGRFTAINNIGRSYVARLFGDLRFLAAKTTGTEIEILFPTIPGRNYSIESKTALADPTWTLLEGATVWEPSRTFRHPIRSNMFYRVRSE